MKNVLAQAGREFLRALGASLIILAPGVLAAPNLNEMYLLGVAALAASVASGLKAIQAFVPALSFSGLVQQPIAAWLDAFTRAFLAALLVFAIGVLSAPELAVSKAAVVAALVAALSAGLRALEGLLTNGEAPRPERGLS